MEKDDIKELKAYLKAVGIPYSRSNLENFYNIWERDIWRILVAKADEKSLGIGDMIDFIIKKQRFGIIGPVTFRKSLAGYALKIAKEEILKEVD